MKQDTLITDTQPRQHRDSGGEPPHKVGKYEVRGEIGRGSCGVVYRGFDPFVQRDVAIKILAQDPARFAAASAEQTRASFFTEARAAGMLQHPHIVSLYDAGVEDGIAYIVMEYIDGDTLAPLCRRSGQRPPVEKVVDIAFKCARALDYSHGKGVMHRDIKPGNIMIARDGVPKIMDFSIAEIAAQPGMLGGIVGSPMFMSPEQVRGETVGPASDLYALGAVMFNLLAGEPPFTGREVDKVFNAILTTPAPQLASLRPELPRQLCEIVDRLLAKEPGERYASGLELATALTRLHDKLRNADKQLTRRENRDSLRRLHFFNTFSDDEIDEIINASTIVPFQAGQTLIQEGEIDHAFYLLALGTAEVRKSGKVLHRLDKGDCFGEIGFLTAAKRTATVVATSQGMVLKANSSLMDQLSLECQLRFYKVFTETLIYRLSVTSAKLSAKA
ncbi:MAG TPA: serine/threonine-protein kinase [Candidatus Binatia bacterium]|nr:serine/threonine-protein kinase [Candidatus Binatia bacterium]